MHNSAIVQKLKAIKWWFVLKGVLVISLLIPVLIIIALAPVIGQPLYNKILFHPMKYPLGRYQQSQEAFGVVPTDVYFRSESGTKLHGFMYKLPQAQKIFLINHGNAGNISHRANVADVLLRSGCSVFDYDYAGYGRSEGQPSIEGICQDAHAAYKYLIAQNYKPNQIILFGESLGTLVTGELARSQASAGIVLQNPLLSLRRQGCAMFPILKVYPDWTWIVSGINFDNATALQKEHPPVLLIAGVEDKLISIEQADALFAVTSEPKTYVRIDGAGHGDPTMMTSQKYRQGLDQFVKALN